MIKFAEAIVALYNALQTRNVCPFCSGSGVHWTLINEDEAEYEPCECMDIAFQVLEQYEPQYRAAIDRFLRERGYDLDQVAERAVELISKLLGEHMTKKREIIKERMTEADATKSYTHSRPRPSTDPPTEKPKPKPRLPRVLPRPYRPPDRIRE